MKRAKKKPKEEGAAKRPQVKADNEGYRPFAALGALKARVEKEAGAAPPAPARKAPPHPPPEPAAPSFRDEDRYALERMMSGVTPLGSIARRIPLSEQTLPSSRIDARRAHAAGQARAEAESVHAHLRALVEGGRFEVEDDGQRVEGRRMDVPPEALRKLRHGLFPVDARIDLHGLRAAEAEEALDQFLREKRALGERCVLVVHGKGQHSPGGVGVLRGEIAAWLSQGRPSVHVLAFATALRGDGGEGAAYVLLIR